MERHKLLCISLRSGFALAEVVFALAVVGFITALIAGLGQQISQFSRRSTQTGTVMDIRSSINSINMNPEDWLIKMRSSAHTHGIYAGCIPDPKANVNNFSCPNLLNDDQISKDEKLLILSGNGELHVSSTPIIDAVGNPLAGTIDNPILLTSDGRPCHSESSKCPLRSIGYMMRSEEDTSKSPGGIKFVVKVDNNPSFISNGGTPMKAQYMSVDIGEEWKKSSSTLSQSCPTGTIKIGYLSDGSPSCINPVQECTTAGTFPIGVNASGEPICKSLPTCTANEGVVLNSTGTDLTCSSSAPCGANNLFLGYFAGSGEPMCSGEEIKCPNGQLQVGITINNGKISAQCTEPPPSCTDANQRLALQGDKFICESAKETTSFAAYGCADNKYMTGMNADGTPKCEAIQRSTASVNLDCPNGQIMTGLNPDGSVKCKAEMDWNNPVDFSAQTVRYSQRVVSTTTPVPYKLCVQSSIYIELSGICTMIRNSNGTWTLNAGAAHIEHYVGCEMKCYN